jgi:hypothetical protein
MKHFMMALLAISTTFAGSFFVNIPTELSSNKFNSASDSSVSIFGIPSAEAQNRRGRRHRGFGISRKGSRRIRSFGKSGMNTSRYRGRRGR